MIAVINNHDYKIKLIPDTVENRKLLLDAQKEFELGIYDVEECAYCYNGEDLEGLGKLRKYRKIMEVDTLIKDLPAEKGFVDCNCVFMFVTEF